jgi:hypothetical protein
MAKVPGSLWVETDGTLHYVGADGSERSYTGILMGAAVGARAGSLWVYGECLYYVYGGNKYYCNLVQNQLGTPGREGSLWVEGAYLHWIAQTTKNDNYAHDDVPHGDAAHSNWGDSWSNHFDTAHADWTNSWGNHNDAHDDWDDHADSGQYADWTNAWPDYQNHDDHTDQFTP